jgi:hypothetical protein
MWASSWMTRAAKTAFRYLLGSTSKTKHLPDSLCDASLHCWLSASGCCVVERRLVPLLSVSFPSQRHVSNPRDGPGQGYSCELWGFDIVLTPSESGHFHNSSQETKMNRIITLLLSSFVNLKFLFRMSKPTLKHSQSHGMLMMITSSLLLLCRVLLKKLKSALG